MELDVQFADVKSRALVKWMPDPDWLVVQLEIPTKEQNAAASEAATQLTVQELLQEREITYRNLLGGVPEASRSEPSENGVPGLRGARTENAVGGD